MLHAGAIPKTPTDRDHEELDADTRREEVKEHLVREGIPEDDAFARAEEAVKADKWFEFVPTQLSAYSGVQRSQQRRGAACEAQH